jgi:alkyl hydroperoxide reductase subunit AhpC
MFHPKAIATATVRTVFIIGPDKTVRLTLTYPASIGRNIDEIIRALDGLQLSAA